MQGHVEQLFKKENFSRCMRKSFDYYLSPVFGLYCRNVSMFNVLVKYVHFTLRDKIGLRQTSTFILLLSNFHTCSGAL